MACYPQFSGILPLLLAVACTDTRTTLLYLLLTALLQLLLRLFTEALSACRLPCFGGLTAAAALALLALLSPVLSFLFPNSDFLSPTQPLTTAIVLTVGGAAVEETVPSARLPLALVLIGLLREGLSTGCLWGVPYLHRAPLSSLGSAGGLLIAAVTVALMGIHTHPFTEAPPRAALSSALLGGVGVALGHLLVSMMPPLYALLAVTLLVGLVAALLPNSCAPRGWALLAPLVLAIAQQAGLAITVVLTTAGTLLLIPSAATLSRSRRLADTPSLGRGLPTALAMGAIVCCLAKAI